jgi:predicted alpha/beta superfamily hydrolase
MRLLAEIDGEEHALEVRRERTLVPSPVEALNMKMRSTLPPPSRARAKLALVLVLLCICHAPSAVARQRYFTKDFRVFNDFKSQFLHKPRRIFVWLPPGYDTETTRRYPVLYMHDGESVFFNWRIDEIAKPLITAGQIEPLIIVMIPNGGTQEDRFDDYTPTHPVGVTAGGKADAYGRMIVEELKPFIDSEFRTLADAPNTALGGSSLGGLASLYLGIKYPAVFGKLAAFSPSVWWDDRVLLRKVKALKAKPETRIWLDIGTAEGQQSVADAKDLRDALVKKGWALGTDLNYFEAKGAEHEEKAFALRAAPMLKFLFPAAGVPEKSKGGSGGS